MSPQARSLGTALALGGAFAVALQLGLSIRHQLEAGRTVGFAVLQYTGYYTIITNSFCALIAAACVWPERFGRFAAALRSAAANRPKRSGHTQAAAINAQKLLVMIV